MHVQRGEEMAGGLVVAPDVNAAHAEVVARADKVGVDHEGLLVRRDGLLGAAAVGQRRAEAVPEQVQLSLLVTCALLAAGQSRGEAVDGLVVLLGAVEEHAQTHLHVGIHVLATGRQLGGLDEEVGDFVVQLGAVREAHLGGGGEVLRSDDGGVLDRQPALQGTIRCAVVALVRVRHGQAHQGG